MPRDWQRFDFSLAGLEVLKPVWPNLVRFGLSLAKLSLNQFTKFKPELSWTQPPKQLGLTQPLQTPTNVDKEYMMKFIKGLGLIPTKG